MKSFLCERTFSVVSNGTFSERRKVKSSVPQGTKCGPLMFNLYTSDISNVLKYCKILMYADDITLYAEINNATDRDKFQTDITNLYAWVQCWGLKINFTKCHCMHFGHKNKSFDYYIAGNIVKPSDCERILGVLIDKDLTFSQQMYACSKKASNVCNMILSNLRHFDNSLLTLLFCVFARPHIEYASFIYNPYHLQYIDLLENVQRKFTKRLHGLYNVSYCERLIACKLESLALQRLYSDIITLYKIIHGFVDSSISNSLCRDVFNVTRGHCYKLKKVHVRLDARKHFLANRVVNAWNNLPNDVVLSSSVSMFARKLRLCNLSSFIRGRAFE